MPRVFAVASAQTTQGTSLSDALPVHMEPSASSQVIAHFSQGLAFDIIEAQGAWRKVNCDGTIGWVEAGLISEGEGVQKDSASADPKQESSIGNEKAYTRSATVGERVLMFDEPTMATRLFGEYYDGVCVDVLEHVSEDWVKVDIRTFGDGRIGYMMTRDLVFGEAGQRVEKTTLLYEPIVDSFMLNTHVGGQSGDIGPFDRNAQVEVLGVVIPDSAYDSEQEIKIPLVLDENILHVKIGDETGFLYEVDSVQPKVN